MERSSSVVSNNTNESASTASWAPEPSMFEDAEDVMLQMCGNFGQTTSKYATIGKNYATNDLGPDLVRAQSNFDNVFTAGLCQLAEVLEVGDLSSDIETVVGIAVEKVMESGQEGMAGTAAPTNTNSKSEAFNTPAPL